MSVLNQIAPDMFEQITDLEILASHVSLNLSKLKRTLESHNTKYPDCALALDKLEVLAIVINSLRCLDKLYDDFLTTGEEIIKKWENI